MAKRREGESTSRARAAAEIEAQALTDRAEALERQGDKGEAAAALAEAWRLAAGGVGDPLERARRLELGARLEDDREPRRRLLQGARDLYEECGDEAGRLRVEAELGRVGLGV